MSTGSAENILSLPGGCPSGAENRQLQGKSIRTRVTGRRAGVGSAEGQSVRVHVPSLPKHQADGVPEQNKRTGGKERRPCLFVRDPRGQCLLAAAGLSTAWRL